MSASTYIPRLTTPACMGGWCQVRTSCRHYHAEARGFPAERLCMAGSSESWQPVTVQRAHVAEHHALAMVQGEARERSLLP